MIEKAVDARKKAREDENSNKELYKAQEALRRATLDSSGKNNAQLLQLQQDLEDKQLEISEKRFEDDMEDRKQWLQDTKDAETETYEYRLETMTWYWEQVQAIMEHSTEEIMAFLITWDEKYRKASATSRSEMELEWETTFDKLKKITESLNEPIQSLTHALSNVTTEVESMDISVNALADSWNRVAKAKIIMQILVLAEEEEVLSQKKIQSQRMIRTKKLLSQIRLRVQLLYQKNQAILQLIDLKIINWRILILVLCLVSTMRVLCLYQLEQHLEIKMVNHIIKEKTDLCI